MNQRCILISRIGTKKARFKCPSGHEFIDYILSAKQRKVAKNANLDILANWWKKGVYCECPICQSTVEKA